MKNIWTYFINGFLIFVPVAATVGLVKWAMEFTDGLMPFEAPGLGLVVLILIVFATGFLASNYLGKKLFELLDQFLNRVPVVKLLYTGIKDMVEAFAGNMKSFDRPVLVELIEDGAKGLGFITRDDATLFGIEDHVAVYFPQSYIFAGQVLIFPTKQITRLDLSSAETMAIIVSGGVSGSPNQKFVQ